MTNSTTTLQHAITSAKESIGADLGALARTVIDHQNRCSDYLVPAPALRMEIDGRSEEHVGTPRLTIDLGENESRSLALLSTGHAQLASRLGIPKRYYDRMVEEKPELLAENVNSWLAADEERRFLTRTIKPVDGSGIDGVRAVLSNSFRAIDHHDVLSAILPSAIAAGAEVLSSGITERRLFVQLATPKIETEIAKGDVVRLGVVLKNSETGFGRLELVPMIYRLACLNGMIMSQAEGAIRKNHVGKRLGELSEFAEQFYSDATRRVSDAAFFLQVQDTVAGMFSEKTIETLVEPLRRAAGLEIPTNVRLVDLRDRVAKEIKLSETEADGFLANLARSDAGGLDLWKAANAVTALAHESESYDRAVELESLGNTIARISKSTFERLVRPSSN